MIRTPVRAPRANAFAERCVGTVRRECLDRLLTLSPCHLQATLRSYVEHSNGHSHTGPSTCSHRSEERGYAPSGRTHRRSSGATCSAASSTSTKPPPDRFSGTHRLSRTRSFAGSAASAWIDGGPDNRRCGMLHAVSRNSRLRVRPVATTLVSVLFVARAGISLVYFAGGGDASINRNAHATLVVVASLGTCVALGALVVSASEWGGARAPRRGLLGVLWLVCVLLMLIEWILSLASSG